MPIPLRAFDVVGVDAEDSGRSCTTHMVCGHHIEVGDILACKWSVQIFHDNTPEACIRVFKINNNDGLPGCHVGYLQKHLLKVDEGKKYDNILLKVIDDNRLSDDKSVRHRSHRNYGIVHCVDVTNHENFVNLNPFEGDSLPMDIVAKERDTLLANDEDDEDDEKTTEDEDFIQSDSTEDENDMVE